MNTNSEYNEYWKKGRDFVPKWSEEIVKSFFSPLIDRNNLLDYGCGKISRKYGDHLSKVVGSYTGADVSEYICNLNKEEGFHTAIIDPENSCTNLPDGQFDAAVCIEVFEHLYDPLAAAREISRLVAPGGILIATVPNFGYFAWRLLALLRARVPHEPESIDNPFKGVHIRFFNVQSLKKLVEMAGFQVVLVSAYDPSSIWDVFRVIPPWSINRWARKNLPPLLQLQFLERVCPNIFGQRLIIHAVKI